METNCIALVNERYFGIEIESLTKIFRKFFRGYLIVYFGNEASFFIKSLDEKKRKEKAENTAISPFSALKCYFVSLSASVFFVVTISLGATTEGISSPADLNTS